MDKINVALEIIRMSNVIADYALLQQAEKVVLEYLKEEN
jgi:hypothetical protein